MAILEFDYQLSQKLSYAKQGKMTETDMLLFKAPKVRHLPLTARLKEIITKAFVSQSKSNQSSHAEESSDSTGDDVQITGEVLLMLIMGAGGDDSSYFVDFCDKFKALMLSEICLIDGEQKINAATYDEISDVDIEQIMGEYTLNFLLPSEIRKSLNTNG